VLTRGVPGVVCLLVGALWILQGVGVAKGSFMTGHAGYTVLGAALVLIGAMLLISAWRRRGEGSDPH
jgi:hypothetical protein